MSGLDIVTKQTISKALGRFQCKYSHPLDSLILDITNLIYPKRVWNLFWKYNLICVYFFFLNLNISKAYTFGLKIMRKQKHLKYFLEPVSGTVLVLERTWESSHEWFSKNILRQPFTTHGLVIELNNENLLRTQGKNKPYFSIIFLNLAHSVYLVNTY